MILDGKLLKLGTTDVWEVRLGSTLVYTGFDPLTLFSGSQQGIFHPIWDESAVIGADGTTPATVGSAVRILNDTSGNGNHATQTTSGNQPVLRVNANGVRYIEFDGVDDFLSYTNLALFNNVPGATIICHCQWRSEDYGVFLTAFSASTFTGSARIFLSKSTTDKHQLIIRRLDSDSAETLSGNNILTNTSQTITAKFDLSITTGLLREDGVQTGIDTTYATTGNIQNTNSTYIRVGCHSSVYAPINLYSLFVVPRALTDTEILNVENYLRLKAGI